MGVVEVLGLGVMWGLGWLQKHKTKVNHKATGVPTNVALGQLVAIAAAQVAGTDVPTAEVVRTGAELTILAEAGLNAVKAVRGVVGGVRRMAR